MSMIYLDNAATTPLSPAVLEAMMPYFTDIRCSGNPSSSHQAGKRAHQAVEKAAEQLADALHCDPREIVFTSGGTAANNLAVFGVLRQQRMQKGRPISAFTTAIEHSSLLLPMQKQANHLTIGAVDSAGTLITLPAPGTDFASIQYANNELGTIQDMPKIAAYCKEHHILLHTDAVQAFPKCEIDLSKLPVDLLSLSAHKFHGPTGVGALFLRTGVQAEPLLYGGNGKNLFAGTENLAGIVGMGAAAEIAYKQRQAENAHKKKLLALLKDGIQKQIPNSMILSPTQHALPDLLSVCFPGLESEGLLALLDLNGICASAGSACHAGEKQASHVLQAIGLPEHLSHSVIRFSIGSQNTEQEILQTIAILQKVTTQLYAVS